MPDNFYSNKFYNTIIQNFNLEDHYFLFFTKYRDLKLEDVKLKSNEYDLIPSIRKRPIWNLFFLHKKIRKKMLQADYIFIHYLDIEKAFLIWKFKKKLENKIIWIQWGQDLYSIVSFPQYDHLTNNFMKKISYSSIKIKLENLFKLFFMRIFYLDVVNKIDFISFVTKGDFLLLNQKINIPHNKVITDFCYPNPIDFEKLDQMELKHGKLKYFTRTTSKLILLGNSGDPSNNHIDALILLSKIKNQDFSIVCPLSYGPYPEYIKEVLKIGNQMFKKRFIPLLKFIEGDKYYQILDQIDISIMNHNRQQGFGNIRLLLFLKKKIYMKKQNPIYNHLIGRKVSVLTIEDLIASIEKDENVFDNENDLQMNKQFVLENYNSKKSIDELKTLFTL